MSNEDDLKDFIEKETTAHQGYANEGLKSLIKKKARANKSKSDFAEFGLIKIWAVLLEICSKIFAASSKKPDLNNNGRKH